MNLEEMIRILSEDGHEEYLKFSRVENPLHARPDICAFLLLDKLVPGNTDIVTSAQHDKIWLDINLAELAVTATPEDITTLIRCGVHLNHDSLAMFV